LAGLLRNFAWEREAEAELERCRNTGCRVLTLSDADYPRLLREIPLPPPVLYLRGRLQPEDERALGVVGSRRPSAYGMQATRMLATELAAGGWTIVSGLALGIDAAAHQAALDAGGRTLAVLAHGLDRVYPRAHRTLHERILEAGAALSEFPLGVPPLRWNFPQRNRLISGLSRGVLVTEASATSGALITARWAAEQGREVFALPGIYHARLSQGTHALIQDGAKLVTGVRDILSEIGEAARARGSASSPAPRPADLTPEQEALCALLRDGARNVDQLAAASGQPVQRLLSDLLDLELQGRVQGSPGGVYQWLENPS